MKCTVCVPYPYPRLLSDTQPACKPLYVTVPAGHRPQDTGDLAGPAPLQISRDALPFSFAFL